MLTRHSIIYLIIPLVILSILGCERKSDEERILEDINSASVHLTTGLKVVVANPDNDPKIAEAQETLHAIYDSVEARRLRGKSSDFTLVELGQLAKVAYSAKEFGKQEVAKGRNSDFQFLAHVVYKENMPDKLPLTVEQDHAITLAVLFALKIHPSIPVPIPQKTMLYEAWMAGDAQFEKEFFNLFIRSLQASTFARNEYCDFALQHTEVLRGKTLDQVDAKALAETLLKSPALGRALAHAPQAAPLIIPVTLLPAALELFPGVARITAHIETANCFSKIGDDAEAFRQQQFAVDAVVDMGAPEADIALLKASLYYKQGDLNASAQQLRKAKDSQLLDERTKQDLSLLADTMDNPDKNLLEKYFSSTAISLTVAKLINQRLKDEGFYDALYEIEQVKDMRQMYEGLLSVDVGDAANDALESGKDFLNKLKNNAE